ncbi:MAG: relaxase [Prevotella sp.]|nr:relaxase [Prevotella sp.]
MIAKVKAVAHGSNLLNYNSGQSEHKKHPEKIFRIKDNLMPENFDVAAIWDMVKLRTMDKRGMKNSVLRFELSPDTKYTKDFTKEDWAQLWDDFIAEYDAIELHDLDTGKVVSKRNNIAGSMYTVWLHEDSKSGIPHLHGAACRVDEEGRTNNDHHIKVRAQWAADRLAIKRGWKTAKQVRQERIRHVSKDCEDILKAMPAWSLENYFKALVDKGYTVYTAPDRLGRIHGYSLGKDFAKYKASELGVGRRLMVSKLAETWAKLHNVDVCQSAPVFVVKHIEESPQSVAGLQQQKVVTHTPDYTEYRNDRVPMDISLGGNTYRRFVPKAACEEWNDMFDYRKIANVDELTNFAAAVFTMLIGGVEQAPVSSGGGGSQSDLPWRDKDEDDRDFARRCGHYACLRVGVKPRRGRGIH